MVLSTYDANNRFSWQTAEYVRFSQSENFCVDSPASASPYRLCGTDVDEVATQSTGPVDLVLRKALASAPLFATPSITRTARCGEGRLSRRRSTFHERCGARARSIGLPPRTCPIFDRRIERSFLRVRPRHCFVSDHATRRMARTIRHYISTKLGRNQNACSAKLLC